MRYALSEMGPAASVRTLLRVNQADGFDCPCCAWATRPSRTATTPSSARTAPRRSPGRRRGSASTRRSSPRTRRVPARADRPLARGQRAADRADVPAAGRHPLHAGRLGRGLRADRRPAGRSRTRTGPCSTPAAGPATRPRSPTSCSPAGSAPTTCPTAPTCATSRAAPRSDETIGIGKGTVTLEDISDHAELIVVVGQNPGTNHPRMLSALEEAKRRGARIVAINPLPEAGLLRFKNPQKARGLGHGTKLADRSCRSGSTATWPCSPASTRRCSSGRTPRRARCSTTPSSTAHRPDSTRPRPPGGPSTGRGRAAQRAARRRSRRRRRS